MKKYLHIPIALLLIAIGIWGCTLNRPRPLLTCFPRSDWQNIQGDHHLPGQGPDGALKITPEELKAAMDGIDVRPLSHFSGWTCETVLMHISTGETTLSVEIGENGDITIAELNDLEGTRTCWRAENAALYEVLLTFCQP